MSRQLYVYTCNKGVLQQYHSSYMECITWLPGTGIAVTNIVSVQETELQKSSELVVTKMQVLPQQVLVVADGRYTEPLSYISNCCGDEVIK